MEIDREISAFLHQVLKDEQAAELRRSAIWALQEWATPESIATLRDLMVNPGSPSDVADSAEALAHTRSPEAVSAALSVLRTASDPSQKLMSAKILWQISATAPHLGVEPTLRGEVRETLQSMLVTTEDAWLRTRISQMIQTLL
jgi:HEAT repeat protein